MELPVIDPQLAVEEEQLLQTGMRVRGILDAGQDRPEGLA
jgi:hypothetical protein